MSDQLSAECCSNVIVLLWTTVTQRVLNLMRNKIRLEIRSEIRGRSKKSVASRMKFLVTTVNSWKSLAVLTK